MSKGKNTVQICTALCQPIAEELGVYIWDVQYVKEGATWYLRVLVDTDEGITIDQCEDFNRRLSSALDEEDPIADSYWLEVSSPGMERELTQDWHYKKLAGATVQVSLYRAIDGQKKFIGSLKSKEDSKVTVGVDDKVISFEEKDIAQIRLYFEI